MKVHSLARLVALLAVAAAACGGPPARAPQTNGDLSKMFAGAFELDAVGDPRKAAAAYLELLRAAVADDGHEIQPTTDAVAVTIDAVAVAVAVDALATRSMPSLGDAADDAALAYRTPDAAAIEAGLERALAEARGPLARGAVARGLLAMAERRGDAAAAARWRAATGCVTDATVLGPTSWAAVTGARDTGPLGDATRIAASYPTGDAFGTVARPRAVRAEGCDLGLTEDSTRPGVRDVVVDVDVPEPMRVGVVLRAHGAATLRVGGKVFADRPFSAGDGAVATPIVLRSTAGKLRLVARVGTAKDDDSVEIDVFGESGAPLKTGHATVGGTFARAQPDIGVGVATDRPEMKLLMGAGFMARDDARGAERYLWPFQTGAAVRPDLALLYARAVETARDLSPATRAERARSAYERVLAAWPTSWEATIAHAVLAGVRRGRDEAGIAELGDLDELRAKSPSANAGVLDAFDALTSGRERLYDRAAPALARARAALPGTAIVEDAADASAPRVGAERVAQACDPKRLVAHDSLACLDALRSAGDRAGEARELARLRSVLGAPSRFAPLELRDAAAAGDDGAAEHALSLMTPSERTLTALSMLRSKPAGAGDRAHLLELAATAKDAPGAIAPLLAALHDGGADPADDLDAAAERAAAADRADPGAQASATAILAHTERYEIAPSGLVHWLLFDVRRVSGTTDVEENAQAAAPSIAGRAAMHATRRRILKRDGRVLEPDRTPRASQEHADLSQLEQGDAVEAVYEGWSVPSDTGDLGIDTPDLLPERTAVRDATIELRLPAGLKGALASHPALGRAVERTDGGARVLTWHLADHPARRSEDGIPKMDRAVGVSFSTAAWPEFARGLREAVAALDERDPEMGAWALEAAGAERGKPPSKALVSAVVIAAGKALRESDPGALADYSGGIAPLQGQTARTYLTSHEGSRTWVIARTLRALGVPTDLVVAENDPFSANPAFPPHYGRFTHPLLVAHVPASDAANPSLGRAEDVWIDADVAGPPLPAGRISPELRGRMALSADGTIAPLPAVGTADGERDEVDVRLALDAKGDARGTFAVVLRGREAQELAEALFRIVGAERQRALRNVVLAWLPWANVDAVDLASSEGSWQVSLRADVSVNGYAQLQVAPQASKTAPPPSASAWLLPGLDTLHWARPRARVSSLAAAFATRAGRENALALETAVQYHVHRRVELPAGAAVARMPGPVDVKARLVGATRKMGVSDGGRVLEDDFTLDVATGTIPPNEYDAFASAAHAADDGFLASTRITMP